MTEQELYDRVVALREEVGDLIEAAFTIPPTIELCLFMGSVGAVDDVLRSLEEAGVPVADPDEELHPLDVKDLPS